MATFAGVITDPLVVNVYAELLARPDYDPAVHDLIDLRGATRLDVSQAALRRVIADLRPVDARGIPARVAIVAASEVAYGMGRMYEQMRGADSPRRVQVFRELDQAVAWILTP